MIYIIQKTIASALINISRRGFSKNYVDDAIGRVINKLFKQHSNEELIADQFLQINAAPLKAALYGTH